MNLDSAGSRRGVCSRFTRGKGGWRDGLLGWFALLLFSSVLVGCGGVFRTDEIDSGAEHSCQDGEQNGEETDVDCGGGECPSCGVGGRCKHASDCETYHCEDGICRRPSNVFSAANWDGLHKISHDGFQLWTYTDFEGPIYDVAVDGDGYLYTAGGTAFGDRGENEVRKLESDRTPVWRYRGHGNTIHGVAVDSEGYLYTASTDGEVHKIDPGGDRVWAYREHGDMVRDVAVGDDGYVYSASEDGEIHKITSGGDQVWTFGRDSMDRAPFQSVAVDAAGRVYGARGAWTEAGVVYRIGSNGEQSWRYTGHEDRLHDLAVDAGGAVYSGGVGAEVHKVGPDGQFQWRYGGHEDSIYAIVLDADGFVYTGSRGGEVHKVDPNGEHVWRYTDHGDEVFGVTVNDAYTAAFPSVFQ